MPPDNANPYDFITSSQQTTPAGMQPDNPKKRIFIVVMGAVVVIIIIVTVFTFLSRAGQDQNKKLIELAQTQTEIVRVAAIGVTKATSLETKALAINTQLSVESSKQDVKNTLKNRKSKVKDKTLTASKNTKNDSLLQEAAVNNRFDQTFTELIQTKLASYQKQAKSVYNSSTPNEQKSLQTPFNSISLLLPKQTNQE